MSTPRVNIQLLGPARICIERKPITISRRIERSILYILAIEHHPISRTKLIDLLWPNAEQVDPRGALRTALSRLRKTFPDIDLIQTDFDHVRLDLSKCTIDAMRFENYYQSLQTTLNVYPAEHPLPIQIVDQVKQALDLWRGDHLIQGENLTSYNEIAAWRQINDHRLTNQRKILLNRLANHYLASGQPVLSLERFLELGNLDILDTNVHLSVLKILSDLSRLEEAKSYCDTLEEAYEKHFNAPLPDEIIEACQFSQVDINARKERLQKEWPQSQNLELQLVGRQSELSQLRQAYFSGGGVVIWGEIGIGKTRLVQELYRTTGPNAFFFLAPSLESKSSIPYAAIIHGLRKQMTKDFWRAIDRTWAHQLWLLMPEIADLRDDIHQEMLTHLRTGQQHLYYALYQLFRRVEKQFSKVVFFLDDAQWVDEQTIQTISFLISQGFFAKNNLLIIAARPQEPNPGLERMIDQHYRNNPFQVMKLAGLNPEELSDLVVQVSNTRPSMDFIAKLYHETVGNPFFTLEFIRYILDQHKEITIQEVLDDLPLPQSVYGLIRHRLNQLEPISRRILLKAAVIGFDFSQKLLLSLAEVEEAVGIVSINKLIQFGFLAPSTNQELGQITLSFPHEKLREVILKEAPPSSLSAIHYKVAEHMANDVQMRSQACIIAQHYLDGGDIKQAYHWFIIAGVHAWKLGTKEDARMGFLKAENLINNAGEGFFTNEEILELFIPWNDFAYQTHQPELEEKIGLRLQAIGEQIKNLLLVGISYIFMSSSCFLRQKIDTAHELILKAIAVLESTTDKRSLSTALARQALYSFWKLDFEKTITQSNQALELSESLERNDMWIQSNIFNAMYLIGMSYYAQGNAQKAHLQIKRIYNDLYPKLITYHKLKTIRASAYVYLLLSNYDVAQRCVEEGLEVAPITTYSNIEEDLLTIRSRISFILGDFDQAYQDATKALELGEKDQRDNVIINAHCILGDIFFNLNNPNQALQHYRIAQIREGFQPVTIDGIENAISLARVLIWLNQPKEAKDNIEKALRITKEKGMGGLYTRALIVSGYCELYLGNFSLAEEILNQAKTIAQQLGLKYEILSSQMGMARLALEKQDNHVAESLIKDILEKSKNYDMVHLNLVAWNLWNKFLVIKQKSLLNADNHKDFMSTIDIIETHTQSDPLKEDFENAKKQWLKESGFS